MIDQAFLDMIQQRCASAASFDAVIAIDFGDDTGFFIDGYQTPPRCQETSDAEAECTISISYGDFDALLKGDLDPMRAFMSGQISIAGNMLLASRLADILQ